MRLDSLMRALLTLLFAYIFSLGATWNGVLHASVQQFNLALLSVIVFVWLIFRWIKRWRWHRSALDGPIMLWAVIFALSLVANTESWRQIAMGLWYMGFYAGVWFLLADLLANKAVRRDTIVDGVLFGGLIVIAFGYVQLIVSGRSLTNLPRPGSVIGNPNALGALLLVLLVLALARWLAVRNQLARVVVSVYVILTGLLIFATFSRGAWFGTAIGMLVLAILWLDHRDMLSCSALRSRWQSARKRTRRIVTISGVSILLLAAVPTVMVIQSLFDTGGRSPALRTVVYDGALQVFAEKPLTGHGLFTFGHEFMQVRSQPPYQPHSHAHNVILQIMAEHGLIGLAALCITVVILVITLRRCWRDILPRERLTVAGGIAALAGYAGHHLLDLPAMMPAIALTGLVILALPLPTESAARSNREAGLRQLGMVALWVGLLLTGSSSAAIYRDYDAALAHAFRSESTSPDYRGGADQMQVVIDADPSLAIYHLQQGYLYAMAAFEQADESALLLAIAAYERATDLYPHYAVGWANLGVVYWRAGRTADALQAFDSAAESAPDSSALWFNLGQYAELAGDDDRARAAFEQALTDATYLWPGWSETPLRQSIYPQGTPPDEATLVFTLARDESLALEQATMLWDASGLPGPNRVRPAALRLLLDLRVDPVADYASRIEALASLPDADSAASRAWSHLVRAEVTRAGGDLSGARAEFAEALAALRPGYDDTDYTYGNNVAHFQFLRLAIPRQFLPGIYFPMGDAALHYLLARLSEL